MKNNIKKQAYSVAYWNESTCKEAVKSLESLLQEPQKRDVNIYGAH